MRAARVTPRLVTALLACFTGLGAAVAFGSPGLAVLVAPWFVLLALGSRREPRITRFQVVTNRRRAMTGESVDVAISISTSDAANVTLALQPSVRRLGPGETAGSEVPQVTVHHVAPGHAIEAQVTQAIGEWGVWDLGRAAVTAESRFGLFRTSGQAVADASVRVHPQTAELERLVPPRHTRRIVGAHTSSEPARGVEFAEVRPFASGDSLRDINWHASARSDALQVSDRYPDRATDVVLLLDGYLDDDDSMLGTAVRAAIAIAEGYLGAMDRVGFVEFGGIVRWVRAASGARHLHEITDALLASSAYDNSAERELPTFAPRVWPARSFVIALSPLADERFVGAVIEAKHRGHDVAVLRTTPAYEPAADEGPLERAAWQLWLAEREVRRAELSNQGVLVADCDRADGVELALRQLDRLRRRSRAHR